MKDVDQVKEGLKAISDIALMALVRDTGNAIAAYNQKMQLLQSEVAARLDASRAMVDTELANYKL
jgi:hypothetical protein